MFDKAIVVMFVCLSFAQSFADEIVDLEHLTKQCITAAKEHKTIHKDFVYKVLHTVRYEGWSGDGETFELTHPIGMQITYAGSSKSGFFWFQYHPHKKFKIIAKSDLEGNFELIGDVGDKFEGFKLRGLMKKGIIKGLWEKSDGQRTCAFYAKAVEPATRNE